MNRPKSRDYLQQDIRWTVSPPEGCITANEVYPELVTPLSEAQKIAGGHVIHLSSELEGKIPLNGYHSGPSSMLRLPNGRLFSQNATVIDENNLILSDFVHEFLEYPKGNRVCHYSGLPECQKVKGRLIALPTISSWKNYYHWLIDAVPKLRFINIQPEDKILTPMRSTFHHEVMARFGVRPEQIIATDFNTHFQADEIIAFSTPLPGELNQEGWSFLKDFFNAPQKEEGHHRYYISRKDTWRRRISNEVELESMLAQFGFETIVMGKRTIIEQAELFSNAELVLSTHGAALSNLAFGPQNAKLIESFPGDFIQPIFAKLTGLWKFPYIGHYGGNRPDGYDYQVDVSEIESLIEKLTL